MDLYSPIFTRKSTRKFDPTPLDSETIHQVELFIAAVKPLLPDSQITYKIVGAKDVKSLLAPNAPHFIVISGKTQPLRNTCAGFLFQHADLYLFSMGLASRWLATVKPKQADSDFIISQAFGKPAEPAARTPQEFDRKSVAEIAEGTDPRFDAVRLAPSGVNGQPWHFTVDGDAVHVYFRKKLGGLVGMTYNQTDLDAGIALCHMAVASEHFGKPFHFNTSCQNPPTAPKGFLYAGTVE